MRYFSSLLALLTLTSLALATPSDEITRAVVAGGAANIESATAAQFGRALGSVLVRVEENQRCPYLTAAIRLRPDLAGAATAATLRAHQPGADDACDWAGSVTQCALTAAPAAKDAIVRAALQAEPSARPCILAAAGVSETQAVSFRPAGVDAGNINSTALGSINPGNFAGQNNIQSGNQERVTICHNGSTLTLPRPAADAHLRNHSGDTIGPCGP